MANTEKGLGSQIVKGTFWIVALEVSNQALQFLKTFYAARLLTPADFGIVGFAFLIIAFLEIISTTGMKEAIIQRTDDLTSYLDTVWLTEVGKGIFILLLTWFAGPWVISQFASANARLTTEVVRFIGAIYFLQCCTSIGVVYFEKEMQFHKFFLYQFSGTVVDVCVSLTLVYLYQSVQGLFYGVLAGTATRVLFSFLLMRYRPGIQWSLAKAKELLHYGKWIFKGKIFNFFGLQADSIIVTSFYSLTSLGIYQMAFRIGNLPMSQVSNIIGRLAFPTFAKLQDQPEKLRDYFLNSVGILTVAFLPVIVLIFGLIPEFTVLMLGEKWIAVVPVVRALILAGFLRIYVSLTDSCFSAIGKPRESSNIQVVRFICFLIVVFPLGYWLGVKGVALSALISLIAVLSVFTGRLADELKITAKSLALATGAPAALGLFAGVVLAAVRHTVDGTSFSGFFALVAVTLIVYGLGGWIINKFTRVKIFEPLIFLIRNLKGERQG